MEELIETLSNYASINSSDIALLKQVFIKRVVEKGAYLLEQGKRADELFFIRKGLVRMFFLNEKGHEVHTYFATDASFITSFSSFINQHSSVESISAVELSEVYVLKYADFVANNELMIKFRTLFVEQNLVCIKERLDVLQNAKAIEKYNYFVKNTDSKICNGIPLYQIASYLGITPESLSRIRKKQFLTKSQE